MLLMTGGFYFWEHRVHVLTIYGSSLINNWNVRRLFDLGASGAGSKVWVLTIGVLEVNPEGDSVWDGLWRPGEAFFQIGLDCLMSHHNIGGLCTFWFKFWRENSKWSSCQQLVTEKDSLSHRFVPTRIKLLPATKEHYQSHRFAQTHIKLFPVA